MCAHVTLIGMCQLHTLQGYAFEYSVLFYGYYDSGQNESYLPPPANPQPYIGHHLHYKLPLGYLLTMLALFVLSVLTILFR